MADIKIQITGDKKLMQAMENPEFIRGPLRRFLGNSALTAESHMKQTIAVDTGHLRASIMANISEKAAAIGPTVFYAPFVEYGTQPHWPPPGALQPWAGRHGFPRGSHGDFLLRWIIAKRGTKAHPFLDRTVKSILPDIRSFLGILKREIELSWRGHAV